MSLIHLLHQAVIQLLRVTYYSSFLVGILELLATLSYSPHPSSKLWNSTCKICSVYPFTSLHLHCYCCSSSPRLLPRQLQQPLSALLVSAFAIPCLNILHHNSYLLKTNVVLLHTLRLKSILFQWPARNYMI